MMRPAQPAEPPNGARRRRLRPDAVHANASRQVTIGMDPHHRGNPGHGEMT